GPLSPVIQKKDIPREQKPCIFHSGVMGVMRWHHQSIMDDLEELLKIHGFNFDPFPALITGRDETNVNTSLEVFEKDRHHVSSSDYTQEQAVLKSRQPPGVVVHGPPGTGKSQTITNIVADALARKEKVLVVCQKRAALDVVA